MEIQLLKDMIDDRDFRIANIQQKIVEQVERGARLQAELDKVHTNREIQTLTHQKERNILDSELVESAAALQSLSRDLIQQGASLKKYANMLRQDQATLGDAAYVMRMQAQVCKAMHSMGILDHQVELAIQHSDVLTKDLKEHLSNLTEEKCAVEIKLVNELMSIDLRRKNVESNLKEKTEKILKEIKDTERQIEDNVDSFDEEDEQCENDEEDLDDEGKEVKEELLKVLRGRRAEMEQLELETEQQAEAIEELEAELADIKGAYPGKVSSPKAQRRKRVDDSFQATDLYLDAQLKARLAALSPNEAPESLEDDVTGVESNEEDEEEEDDEVEEEEEEEEEEEKEIDAE